MTIEYIFCINPGRSGSDYLCKIFNEVNECNSFHEPLPICNDNAMRKFLAGNQRPLRKLFTQKLVAIQKQKKHGEVYVETNHCFIKGFGWLLPEYISEDKIGVIVLHRQKAKVVNSYLKILCTPLTTFGRNWVMTPTMKSPVIPPPHSLINAASTYFLFRIISFPFRSTRIYKKLSITPPKTPTFIYNYEKKCLEWYFEETYAQARSYQDQFKKIKFFDTDIDELNSIDGVSRMLSFFNCTAKDSIATVIGKPSNLR